MTVTNGGIGKRKATIHVPAKGEPVATAREPLMQAEATPKPKTAGIFGGITSFFQQIQANPILLIIAMVIVVFVIGKMF